MLDIISDMLTIMFEVWEIYQRNDIAIDNKPDSLGRTGLHVAVYSRNITQVQLLVEQGANINARSNDGITPLYQAVHSGYTDIVKFLVEQGADIKAKNSNGYTSLHLAAMNNNMDLVKFLVGKGADINEKNNYGNTPLHLAARFGHEETVKILVESQQENLLLINSLDSDKHSIGYYTNNPVMQQFLFKHGMIPEQKKVETRSLLKITEDRQSVHDGVVVKRADYVTNLLVEFTGTAIKKEELERVAAAFQNKIDKLFNDPLKIKLLDLSEQEKNSIAETVKLSAETKQNNDQFVLEILNQAKNILQEKYLNKPKGKVVDNSLPALPIQYSWVKGQEKYITIPETIGRVLLLIDKLEMPYIAKQELLVTLMMQSNEEELKEPLKRIQSLLNDDTITLEQLTKKEPCHKLLNKLANQDKADEEVTKLFSNISSGLDIKEIWQEQKKFKLAAAIYIAGTTYGENNSACLVGIWQQLIASIIEINSTWGDEFVKYNEKQRNMLVQEANSITKISIEAFVEDLAKKLIELSADQPNLKGALYDLSLGMLYINEPNSITLEQQKILTKINTFFTEKIKTYLPSYTAGVPTEASYKILIDALTASVPMKAFGQECMKQENDSSKGAGSGTTLYESESYWYEYSKVAIKEMLEIRLKSLGGNTENVKVLYPNYIFSEKTTALFVRDLVAQISGATTGKYGGGAAVLKLLIPVNLNNPHWVGMTVEFTDGKIKVTYMDSEDTLIPNSLRDGLKTELARFDPNSTIEIAEKAVEKQKYNNCGLHVIELDCCSCR